MTVQQGGVDTAQYTYDGDGNRVKTVVDGKTTLYLGNYYEVETDGSSTTTRRYDDAGALRVAMRENDTLFYLLSDHPAPRMGGGGNQHHHRCSRQQSGRNAL